MKTKSAIIMVIAGCFWVNAVICEEQAPKPEAKEQVVQSEWLAPKVNVEQKTSSFNEMVVRHAKRMCNKRFYETFSQDGRDFIEFWLTASEVNLDMERAYTCMRLFYNNSKSCNVVDASVVDQVSKVVPQLFERYFELPVSSTGEFKAIRGNVEDLMLDRFTDRYDTFQNQPDLFIAKLSVDITSLVKSRLAVIRQGEEEYELREKMRGMILRFLDMSIGKIIWYEEEYQSIWSSVLSIADNLHSIGKRGIVNDQDNLDELWDSLVRRFVWFLDFNGSALPLEFYEQVEEDLETSVVFFLEIDEQDDGIRSKKDMIAEAIVTAKAKAMAYEHRGLVTDQNIRV